MQEILEIAERNVNLSSLLEKIDNLIFDRDAAEDPMEIERLANQKAIVEEMILPQNSSNALLHQMSFNSSKHENP